MCDALSCGTKDKRETVPMFFLPEKRHWLHGAEVKLEVKQTASVLCLSRNQPMERKIGKQENIRYGLVLSLKARGISQCQRRGAGHKKASSFGHDIFGWVEKFPEGEITDTWIVASDWIQAVTSLLQAQLCLKTDAIKVGGNLRMKGVGFSEMLASSINIFPDPLSSSKQNSCA